MTDYSNALNQLIKKLGFKLIKKFRENLSTGHVIYMGNINDNNVVLRVIPANDKAKLEKMQREKFISDVYYQKYQDIKRELVAKILSLDHNDIFVWSIRKYYVSKILSADQYTEEIFHGYDRIRSEFIEKSDSIIESLCQCLNDLHTLSFNKDDSFLKSTKYIQDYYQLDGNIFKNYLNIDIKNYKHIFELNKEEYFDPKNQRACTGDLSPANILIKDKFDITLYDLEYFCIDHPSLDSAYLWLFLWKYSTWQDRLLKEIIVDCKSKDNFRFSVIRSILSIYQEGILGYAKNKDKEIIYRKFSQYKNHKWTKYLKAAGESYEAIMNVKVRR